MEDERWGLAPWSGATPGVCADRFAGLLQVIEAEIVLGPDAEASVGRIHRQGASIEALCVELLVPGLGENNRLGIAMVVEFFRRTGWTVDGDAPDTMEELRSVVRSQW